MHFATNAKAQDWQPEQATVFEFGILSAARSFKGWVEYSDVQGGTPADRCENQGPKFRSSETYGMDRNQKQGPIIGCNQPFVRFTGVFPLP